MQVCKLLMDCLNKENHAVALSKRNAYILTNQPLTAQLVSDNTVIGFTNGEVGSTPRQRGAVMAVFPEGRIISSIGGGRMESEVISKAKAVFWNSGRLVMPNFT